MTQKADLLFIAHRIPYPPDKGDKIRSYHMVRHLAKSYRVTVACMIDDPADVRHVGALKGMVHQVFFQVRPPLAMKARAVGALLTGRPCTLPCFYSRALQREIDGFLDRRSVTAVLCFCSSAADYVFRSRHLSALQQAVLLADLVDIDSEKWREYAARQRGPMAWLYRREARLLLPFEQRIVAAFDRTFVVSEEEKAVLVKYGPVDKVEALSNGVDLDYFFPAPVSATDPAPPARLIFSGAMDYWPNSEGAVWFAREVFPVVKQAVPDAVFCIAGRNPTEAVLALKNIPAVEVTGTIPDMRTHLAGATLCVVPLTIARGIQNKVLEGMAMGKPVVATSGAATGLKAVIGEDLVVADGAAAMARAVVDLLRDPVRQRAIGQNARAYVERAHSWDAHLKRLDEVIQGGAGYKDSAECKGSAEC
ncbi:TIGR03087 family PEP-CTERM/XrtA system glycosyltransferase [Desulfoprunum benzoelyticum]|uniref:Sugar transferase (PEP-CTERM/EpsH1 system associated) n=1 Tax=Desulfoprunum benzoelyticum TaxID=1506996 RepID=A0A840UMI6_9BACT|nr:TIGR03087 family PEP-CTERM/XrtA system glycosyltransferase [Desulfoprunum benzoelyticum]MBB5346992.1 sugar transferase (PEP-CTERM/EpsH1 system associated) [Desulfoprunum benzoelyticum]MBM9531640.1 TIGR03087 family PEP-CTERM/XrtA system glycosyltransferase [Desulfoprunum benzoelyticum]